MQIVRRLQSWIEYHALRIMLRRVLVYLRRAWRSFCATTGTDTAPSTRLGGLEQRRWGLKARWGFIRAATLRRLSSLYAVPNSRRRQVAILDLPRAAQSAQFAHQPPDDMIDVAQCAKPLVQRDAGSLGRA